MLVLVLVRTQRFSHNYTNTMAGRKETYLALICVLWLKVSPAVKVGHVLIQSEFCQTQLPSAEFAFQFDDDEIFNVDFEKKLTRWRLPQFGQLASFEAAGALQNKAVDYQNLQVDMKRTNFTAAKPVTPTIYTYTEEPVVLNEPNTVICLVKNIFPPVIKMSWLKNNQPVTDGMAETDFYISSDFSYYKFTYLATMPAKGDVYTCAVEHSGLPGGSTNKPWRPEVPSHIPETSENVVCGLGLAVGIIGIIVGICLIVKGLKNSNSRGH